MSDLSSLLGAHVQATDAAGIAVVWERGATPEVVWSPAQPEEPCFLAYSVTKTFIATLFLLSQEEGGLTLEAPLVRWFPSVAEAESISLRQLLNHTAGTPDYGGLRSYHEAVRASPSHPWSFERFAEETFRKGLLFPPGDGWAYSNPGYMLLKAILENVTGQTLGDLIAERITKPLELQHTFVAESIQALASLAAASSLALAIDGTPRDVRACYHPGWVSHGVVAATASDIVRFVDACFARGFLSQQSLIEMTTVVPVPIPTPANANSRWRKPSYGLGIMADPLSPWGRLWGHNGGGPGYSASVFHLPEQGITVCVMAALEGKLEPETLVFAVLDAQKDATG